MRKQVCAVAIVLTELFSCPIALLSADELPGVQPIVISSPRDGATVGSSFIALTGTASPSTCFEIAKDDQTIRDTCADSTGHLDAVIRANPGSHVITIFRKEAHSLALSVLHVSVKLQADSPRADGHWELLREGDVILSSSQQSLQQSLYSPVYTHAAMYIGPGPDGAAMIAEAVSEESAQGLGEVRAVTIERTLEWGDARSIDIFRLKGGLLPAERDGVLRFARSVVNRGLKFWTTGEDFSAMYAAWLQWNPSHDRPFNANRFQDALDKLRAHKFSVERFNCATLVWRAFWEGSKQRVDLSDPNHLQFGGQLAAAFTPGFLDRVRPYVIAPDTLYRSGRLEKVQPPR